MPARSAEVEAARVASAILINALIRRVEAEGGHGMVLAKGDANAGAILLVLADRGMTAGLRERTLLATGAGYGWTPTGPADLEAAGALADYLARRRRSDPDLWAVELDHPRAEAIAAELLG